MSGGRSVAVCRRYVECIGIRNTWWDFLFVIAFHVFFCFFVPLFNFVSRIRFLRFG
jgi:hypothetical protein